MRRPTRRYHLPSALRGTPLRLDVDAARELVAAGAVLVDVRRHDDPTNVLEQALRIPPDEMPARVTSFLRSVPIVLACT